MKIFLFTLQSRSSVVEISECFHRQEVELAGRSIKHNKKHSRVLIGVGNGDWNRLSDQPKGLLLAATGIDIA